MLLQRNAKCYEEKSCDYQIYHCLKVKTSFHKKLFQKEKNKLSWISARQLSSHLRFNGQQKSPVASLSWNPWLYINDLPDNVICNIATYADDTTLYSKCEQASDLWQQLELASELESELSDTVDWGKKWLVDFNAGKMQLV